MGKLAARKIGGPIPLKSKVKKKLNLSGLIKNAEMRYSKREGLNPEKIYISFSGLKKSKVSTCAVEIKIGMDIFEEMNLDVEKVRFCLFHDPDNRKKLILVPAENGNKLNILAGRNYAVFRQVWRENNAWIIPEEQRNKTTEVEFELYENAIMVMAN